LGQALEFKGGEQDLMSLKKEVEAALVKGVN